jgi:hypothetical protein
MKRRLEVLLGVLLASASMLGGCIAQPDDGDADDEVVIQVGQARSALVGAMPVADPTRSAAGPAPSAPSAIGQPGSPEAHEPEPQPWKPPNGPPSAPGMPDQER